jgi:hypothetical protein
VIHFLLNELETAEQIFSFKSLSWTDLSQKGSGRKWLLGHAKRQKKDIWFGKYKDNFFHHENYVLFCLLLISASSLNNTGTISLNMRITFCSVSY